MELQPAYAYAVSAVENLRYAMHAKLITDQTHIVQDLISDMKAKLEELSDTPANLQRLVFRGHVLKDEQPLSHHSERLHILCC